MAQRHSELSSSPFPDERLQEDVAIFVGDQINDLPTDGANVEASRS